MAEPRRVSDASRTSFVAVPAGLAMVNPVIGVFVADDAERNVPGVAGGVPAVSAGWAAALAAAAASGAKYPVGAMRVIATSASSASVRVRGDRPIWTSSTLV